MRTIKLVGRAEDYAISYKSLDGLPLNQSYKIEILAKAEKQAFEAAHVKNAHRAQVLEDHASRKRLHEAEDYRAFVEAKIADTENEIRRTELDLVRKERQLSKYWAIDRFFRFNKKAEKAALENKLESLKAARADMEAQLPDAIDNEIKLREEPNGSLLKTPYFSLEGAQEYQAFLRMREQSRGAELKATLEKLGLAQEIALPPKPEGLVLVDIENIIVSGPGENELHLINVNELQADYPQDNNALLAAYARPLSPEDKHALFREAELVNADRPHSVAYGNQYNFVQASPDKTGKYHDGSNQADFLKVEIGQLVYAFAGDDRIKAENSFRDSTPTTGGPVKTFIEGGEGFDTVTFDLRDLQIRRLGNYVEIKTLNISEASSHDGRMSGERFNDKEDREIIWTLKNVEEIELVTKPRYQSPSAFIDVAKVKNTEWQTLRNLELPDWIDDSNLVIIQTRNKDRDTTLYETNFLSHQEKRGLTDWGSAHMSRRDFADLTTAQYLKSVASEKPGIGDHSHWSLARYDDSNQVFSGTPVNDNLLIRLGFRLNAQDGNDHIWYNESSRDASKGKLLETHVDGGSGSDTFHFWYDDTDSVFLTRGEKPNETVLTVKHHCYRHKNADKENEWFIGDDKGTCPIKDHASTHVYQLKNVETLAIHGREDAPSLIFLSPDHQSYEYDEDSTPISLKHFISEAA
ncbi:hypothetical protein [Limoniibacter endophyticus]|nr:hypothetical protein [Limoniibacter endophyticus]